MPTAVEIDPLIAQRHPPQAPPSRPSRARSLPRRARSLPRRARLLPRRTAAPWTPWLIAIACVAVGLPVAVSALSGNSTIPHNDAWSMSRIAATFAGTGHIRLLNWNDMNLIGQVVMLGPLGSSLAVQQAAVAILSLLCLFFAYRLLAVSLTTRDALLGTALLGVWPGWASLSTSFETDVPTLAATLAALLLGRRALMRDSVGWLAAMLLVSLWAVSIREQAIVAPIVVLAYGWLTRRSRRRLGARNLCLAALGTAAVLVAFEVWRWGLPHGQNPAVTAGVLRFLGGLVSCGSRTYFTLALLLAPAVLVGAGRQRWSRRDCGALGVGLVVVALAWQCGGVLGRYFEPSGEYSQVLPGTRVVIPSGLWDVLLALGCVSGTLLIPVARERWRRSVDPLLGLFTVLMYAEIVTVGAAGHSVFDRYLPALVPGTLAVVLSHPTARSIRQPWSRSRISAARDRITAAPVARGAAAAALALIGVTSALLAANGFAFDAARWHAAQRAVRTGVAPGRVAAGLEWTGWHSPHGVLYGYGQAGRPGGWELAFYREPACVVVSSSPLSAATTAGATAWTPAGTYAYDTFLVGGRSRLYLYRTHAPGCGV